MAVTINGTTGIVTPDLGVDGTTLVVDAANDRVGIGQSSPTKKLEVGGGAVSFSPDVAGKHTHEFTTNAANDARYFLRSDTTTKVDIQANGASYFNGGEVLIGTTIDANIKLDVEGSLRAKAAAYVAPTSGVGLELYYATTTLNDTPTAYITSYDRDASAYKKINYDASEHKFRTSGTEKLRITSGGQLLVNTTTFRSFSDNSGNGPTPLIQIEATNSSAIMSIVSASTADSHRAGTINLGRHRNTTVGATPTVVNNGDTLGAVVFSGGDGSDMLSVAAHIRGVVDGTPGNNDMPGALSFSTTPAGSSSPYNQERMRITSTGLVNVTGGIQVTENVTPTSGRGIEIFEASAGVGQISSYNRTGNSWDELRLKGSEVAIYTGTSNSLGLYLQSTQSTLYGTSDGILNLDTTDGRGAFLRFKENGTSKGWVGCSEGLGTGGDQDDFGIRAVGGFRVRTGTTNRIEISEEGQILFKPVTGGFTTSGAAGTFPGAAVAIDCHGVGPGTGTNIPQYGLYVDAVGSSNDATLMTGIYAISKQNVENSAIGVHGLYERDWSSYTKKIGGLFQAPARGDRYATLSMNPGGGNFINTTDTGHANKLATGGNRPDGAADGSASYGDCTGLWGDIFKSDTATGTVNKMVAIKATNRATHAALRVGLLVGMVDGNDATANRKNTQFVEYYTNSNHQRYYARNHRKEVNTHYPIYVGTADGTFNSLWNTQTGKYYIKNIIGLNQYSWYFFNCYGASYARNGRLKLDIAWTTAHAAGVGEGSYSVAYSIHHGDSRVYVRRFTRFHQYQVGGSYYGWSSSPHLDVFQTTSTGSSAGIYLRVRGHVQSGSFDGYGIQSIRLEADENTYGFSTESSFRFVGNSTPTDADTTTGAITISTPSTS